jgi:hypothetical protein
MIAIKLCEVELFPHFVDIDIGFKFDVFLFFQVFGGFFPRLPHHAIDLKFEYKYGEFNLRQHIWARHFN